jgi:hypothetical protein
MIPRPAPDLGPRTSAVRRRLHARGGLVLLARSAGGVRAINAKWA